ncbi:MAG: dethiobiotin synthase [Hyphomonadaceae bacterium]|nr:dethiobiotin synthase [Hyphomonadaceae bacterium]
MRGAFITAIGTDCGKTHVSAAILRHLRSAGRPALALKPVMSGYSPDQLETSDAGRLLLAMGRTVDAATVGEICWRSFVEPLAPNVAARRAGVALAYADMLSFLRERMARHTGPVLVEGAGGVMSPLTDTHTNIDLAQDLGLPVVLLASSYLGAVSHTLTAVDVLTRRHLKPVMIVVTEPSVDASPAALFIDELRRWTAIPLYAAPFAPGIDDSRGYGEEITTALFG